MKALVVDDSRTARMILKQMLKPMGFEVSEAGDGKEALGVLEKMGRPDLVLVDWDMPVMDGYTFVNTVRSKPEYDPLPLMMITAHTDPESVMQALQAGANEYVMKPFNVDVIREKLELLGIAAG
jgi:two-component system, chemotaxis family, chemotaxis protein CheY